MLLDTNAYLRIAKRIRPLLGVPFAQKGYVLTVLKQVEDEVHRSPKLKFIFPWFDETELAEERVAQRIRLKPDEKLQIESMKSVLLAHVAEHIHDYTSNRHSPPSPTDTYILAFGQLRSAIVVTDDLGMHRLAADFDIPVWHGYELLKKMLGAKQIDKAKVVEIYSALENNGDLQDSWKAVRHTVFRKVFGPAP
ncbi:MAG: hypothetical protein WD772_03550 [Pseudohongiellaceae bacterium]